MGNSEVGHMTIGSGRILYQNLVKIDRAIDEGSLEKNEALQSLLSKCRRLHVIGLYSDGGVHSHLRHFDAICEIAQNAGCETWAHAITDGRDVSPSIYRLNLKSAAFAGAFTRWIATSALTA